jgi:cyclohexyl-isocyanide hydratase
MDDEEVLAFVRRQGLQARYVTSVCTGALVLGAAGLLEGYEATTHWASLENLEHFGAKPAQKRICIDRNRITGGGVTAGIDFGLYLASLLADRKTAEKIQLFLEYDPAPPFDAGSPAAAPAPVVTEVRAAIAPMLERRMQATLRAAERLHRTPRKV